MKNIGGFILSENFQFLKVKFSIYLYRRVFVMVKSLLCDLEVVDTIHGHVIPKT